MNSKRKTLILYGAPNDDESDFCNEEEIIESSENSDESLSVDEDNSCKIIPKKAIGYHLTKTSGNNPQLHGKKQKLSLEMNSILLENEFVNNFKENWIKSTPFSDKNLELIVDPFKMCVVQDFLQNTQLLENIRQEFYELDFNQRTTDLYEFFQSKDMKYLNSEYLKSFHDFLKNDVMNWVSSITNLNLTHISSTCSAYTNTDYLLVHDDQREDRMVAFIFYLTCPSNWTENMGGALELFNKDSDGQPHEVVRKIFPFNNQFAFFPVTNDSYHQVGEVTYLEGCRLSINGWFHSKTPPVFETPVFQPTEGLFSNVEFKAKEVDIELESWINEDYLDTETINQIQSQIEENSEISLKNFFKEESFREILQILQSEDVQWKKIGPPNRHSYEVMNAEKLPHSLERLLDLFQSKAMFSLLHRYTDLDLTTPTSSMKFELQRWTPESYSLLTDHNWQAKNELDLIIYFGCGSKSDVIGARTQYVTVEDEIQNALITIEPQDNYLNIVYRDSARFTKYFSKQSRCRSFFTLVCCYSE